MRYMPRSECWFFKKPEGEITFEVSQKGKKIVTLKMSEFRAENEWGSLYKSQINMVVHSDGRTTADLVWRFQ
jgi:hypothetical protein